MARPWPLSSSSFGAREFTRIFVRPSAVTEQPVKPVPTIPTSATLASGTPRLKGFSSPGVSDSASAEGSFTQIFGGSVSAAASAPPAPVSSDTDCKGPGIFSSSAGGGSSSGDSAAEGIFVGAEPKFAWRDPKLDGESDGSSGFFTWRVRYECDQVSLSKLLGYESHRAQPSGQFPSHKFAAAAGMSSDWGESRSSFPSFSSAPSTPVSYTPPKSESASEDLGSVTRLIRRLSEDVRAPSSSPAISQTRPVSANAFASAAPPAAEPAPLVESGPGEFTRMISGDSIRAALSGQAPPAPAPASSSWLRHRRLPYLCLLKSRLRKPAAPAAVPAALW